MSNDTVDEESGKIATSDGLLEGFLSEQRCKVADRLIPTGSRTGRILDIGCGAHPRFLIRTEFSEKYGLDRVSEQNEHARYPHAITRLDCDIAKEDRLPFEDKYFDVITMLAVFEHIEPERLVEVVAEIHRILRPGGVYILTTPAIWTDGLLRFMAQLRLINPVLMQEHKDAYSPNKISSILQRGGFSMERLQFGYFEMFMNIWATAQKQI